MIHFRVHLVVEAEELARPLMMRNDVVLAEDDPEAARAVAEQWARENPLTITRIISRAAEKLAL